MSYSLFTDENGNPTVVRHGDDLVIRINNQPPTDIPEETAKEIVGEEITQKGENKLL